MFYLDQAIPLKPRGYQISTGPRHTIMQEPLHGQGLANYGAFKDPCWSLMRGPQRPTEIKVTAYAEAHRPHRLEGPEGVGVDGQDAARAGLSLLTVLSH
jgi:hypothetical protein